MDVFEPEEVPLLSYETSRHLEQTFKQQPNIVPLTLQPREIIYVQKDYTPLAIVGLVLGAICIVGLFVFGRRS